MFEQLDNVARHLPITKMIDTICTKIMIQRAARRSLCDVLTPDIEESLKSSFSVSRAWNVSRSSDDVFEVSSNLSITVDLEKRTCSCHLWHIDGVLCYHAVVVTQKFSKDLNMDVDTFLHVEMYHGAYADATCPIPTIDKPNMPLRDVVILPPLCRKPSGRRPKKRILQG
ncbi:Protein FAR1-RELATED SEQUENCE like [Actinidia chinensis var. chinensis]|uniref:Protein FAR1-RELATED SEQUENCE like n=1 Tax=Actinidia chinensis var. chinensis TaxID=1590841 RepID=A0A2R6QHK5_ACTCC|nr:Protein FAR1-RELATED SEQUENCE like [Actinidia chinensis var. chinensis]